MNKRCRLQNAAGILVCQKEVFSAKYASRWKIIRPILAFCAVYLHKSG